MINAPLSDPYSFFRGVLLGRDHDHDCAMGLT